ncbi:hypothetical protein [Allorhodopirellula heiligendammensis]|uniref:Uncharacterized protein n=1 Tax=Allorhodopirellula heiligendammensis TaxID=2714739 RepID=A0A5C6BZM4_9BACT|nr:hypothetical protein [Allorhodopirellula heiligendammensis]TWU16871.1 hypothetical protein Poly21_40790 [Allorhodopirellula heiligendammensis]
MQSKDPSIPQRSRAHSLLPLISIGCLIVFGLCLWLAIQLPNDFLNDHVQRGLQPLGSILMSLLMQVSIGTGIACLVSAISKTGRSASPTTRLWLYLGAAAPFLAILVTIVLAFHELATSDFSH